MTALPRRLDACEHRISLGDGEHTCGLAGRILGDIPGASARTADSICRECCRAPLQIGPRLNPVVASLVFTAAEGRSAVETPPGEFIARHWARQFAVNSLETAERIVASPRPRGTIRPPAGPSFAATPRSKPSLGLAGPNSRYGLGHIYRDLVKHLEIARWLISERPAEPDYSPANLRCPWTLAHPEKIGEGLMDWLQGLDALLFLETPPFPGLCRAARELGVLVICVPMWEWLHPGLDWLEDVDVMLAPTGRTAATLQQWQHQFGFEWRVDFFPWPIDADAFKFRRRYRAEQFVYVQGSGGFRAYRNGLEHEAIRRKGLVPLLQAAREVPAISLIIYGAEPRDEWVPPNVEFRAPPVENHDLYLEGDVCLQPSLWEGLGLPLLECQAAGMPLVTTNLPPMNEHQPLAVIPAKEVSAFLKTDHWIPAADICPDDIARCMRNLHRRWIPFASGRARRFIVDNRNWRSVRGVLERKIATWVRDHQSALTN